MDLLAGDRQILNPEDFPHHIAPFPEASNLFCHNPAAAIQPPDSTLIDHRPNLPPQKLRPIRCGGGFSGAVERPLGGGSPEVGLLSNQMCAFNRKSSEYFESAAKDEAGNAAGNGGSSLVAEEAARFGSIFKGRVLEDESSSSSGDDDDSTTSLKEHDSRKRKRKSRKKLVIFLESLVMKVMDKQEQMHSQLIEMIEKRERDRIAREEAWKRQEMERMRRDEELRVHEASRSIALISFIHNALGNENEIPLPTVSSCWEESGDTIVIQKDIRDDLNNKRWPVAEVQALITLRTALEHKFRVLGSKGSIWEEISVGMHSMGYNRNAKKCKEKWENINKYFKRSIGSGKKPVACPYFRELDILYKNGLIYPGNASNIANSGNDCKSEE